MANVKITDMTPATTPLAGTELFETVQGGGTASVAASDIAASFATDVANILPVSAGGSGVNTITGYVYGNGTSDMTGSTTIPFNALVNWAYGAFAGLTDESGATGSETAVKFGTNMISGAGVSIVTDGAALTRITLAAAGTYLFNVTLQFGNSDTNDHDVTVWLEKNGTDVANSTIKAVIPKVGDGGIRPLEFSWMETVTAGQYITVMWLPENATVTLVHDAAVVGPPAYPAKPSSTVSVNRVA
jgi:hypothetical protein